MWPVRPLLVGLRECPGEVGTRNKATRGVVTGVKVAKPDLQPFYY